MITNLDILMLMKSNAESMDKTISKLNESIVDIGTNALKDLKKIILLFIEPDEDGAYSITYGHNEFYYVPAVLKENGEIIRIKSVHYKQFKGLYIVTDDDRTYSVNEIKISNIPNLLKQTTIQVWNVINKK